MEQPDPILVRLARAVALGERGDRGTARVELEAMWAELGDGDDDALRRMAVAHAAADVQDDARAELAWDERALDAADRVTEAQLRAAGMTPSVHALYPSLHLDLADVHRRVGDVDEARRHVRLGRGHLGEDGEAAMIGASFDRIEASLGAPADGG
ncbi:MAG: hypothetical protein S0880_18185 [Actinomycetota bacterium]|nr:hypothetical protein [Actinomycetota bacterium]